MLSRLSVVLLLAAFLVALLPAVEQGPPARAEGEPLVLAFYYAWFDKNTWNSNKVPDRPATLYNSDDHAAISRQIDQAQGAGIDAFVLNWWGTGNRTEKNLKAMLDIAAQKGFRVSVDFDINSPVMGSVGSYAENLKHLHATHANHPAYLRWHGRPVVFFYNVARLPVSTWASLRDQADPGRNALWIAEGVDIKYQSVFDGHHLYSVTWPNRIPPAQTLASWAKKVRTYNKNNGTSKLWVATVMPGYDDRKVRPGSGFARSRDGGAYYRQCWEAAIASKPQWVIINSFNEWPEGSYIEASQAYGSLYMDLTRELAARFKGSSPAVSAAPPAPPTAVPPAPTPAPTPTLAPTPRPTSYVIEDPRVPSGGLVGPRCGYVYTENGSVSLWEVYCHTTGGDDGTILLVD